MDELIRTLYVLFFPLPVILVIYIYGSLLLGIHKYNLSLKNSSKKENKYYAILAINFIIISIILLCIPGQAKSLSNRFHKTVRPQKEHVEEVFYNEHLQTQFKEFEGDIDNTTLRSLYDKIIENLNENESEPENVPTITISYRKNTINKIIEYSEVSASAKQNYIDGISYYKENYTTSYYIYTVKLNDKDNQIEISFDE